MTLKNTITVILIFFLLCPVIKSMNDEKHDSGRTVSTNDGSSAVSLATQVKDFGERLGAQEYGSLVLEERVKAMETALRIVTREVDLLKAAQKGD